MIQLQYRQNHLILKGSAALGTSILSRPLHRLYLKSTLGATTEAQAYVWAEQDEFDLAATIESIVEHFRRYEIEVEVDDYCSRALRRRRDEEAAFEGLLERGRAAKHNPSLHSQEEVSKTLSPEFRRHLKQYQIAAVQHLLSVGNAANYSVPGSGKTTVALAYYQIVKSRSEVDGLLVVGPAACFEPWEREYEECFGRAPISVRLAGIPKFQRDELYLLADQYELLLTTYHSASRDVAEMIHALRRRNYLVVLDEAHYIKRPQGGKIADAVLSLARHATHRVILTGTPMPNGLEDLWSQFAFLWLDRSPLGPVESYLAGLKGRGSDTSGSSVRDRIDPLFFRTTKRQLHLPPVSFKKVRCDMSPLQRRIYKGVAARFLTQLIDEPKERDALREWRRARAMRLLQIASNPTLLRQSDEHFILPALEYTSLRQGIEHYACYEIPGKFHAVESIVRRLCGSGNKVIVWSSFVHNLRMLEKLLHEYSPVLVYGSVPVSSSDEQELSREDLITRFKTDENCRLLIANPAACAESISLHRACHHAVYLDRTFNCAHYMQSLDRIHRIGLQSDQKTYYYLLIARDTIDEIIQERLKQKMRYMEGILEDDLPGLVPGYWGDDFGDEEDLDLEAVEEHIREIANQDDC